MRKYILIIVSIGVVLLIFYSINRYSKDIFSEIDISEKNFDKNDSLIFKNKALSKMEVVSVIKSKSRNPLKFYKYNDKYNLYSTKIDLKNDISLDELISFENELTSQDSFVPYLILPSSKTYSIKFRDEKSAPISKIYLSLSGNEKQLKKIVHNEYFISYSLPLTTFSLQYENKNNPIDVFVEANGSNLLFRKKVPFVVSFYKKEKSVYLLVMTTVEKDSKLDEKILEEIIEY